MNRFLLLQARTPGDAMARHEHDCFAATLGVPIEQVTCFDLLAGVPGPRDLDEHPMLLVGGSGAFSSLDSDPWLTAFFDFLTDVVVARKVPTFASCFGFQCMVMAGGGTMVRDPDNTEVGAYEIVLTEVGLADPLLGPCAPSFLAQEGHKDKATRLPVGLDNLGGSEGSPLQAFRIPDSQVVATQFHPELDRAANRFRYLSYLELYQGSSARYEEEIMQRIVETPVSSALLPRWVEAVSASGLR
jgi:GMP synthase (glutamine-hydrolysing)